MVEKQRKITGINLVKFIGSTFGQIGFATFIISGVSGLFLALFYNITEPYNSVSKMLIANQSASFFRSLHYWSSQLFLISTILHIWDHLRKSTETKIKQGVWIRLTISVFAIFFVMLTGFILKGDVDAQQAKRILSAIINSVPIIGNTLSLSFLGSGEDLQLIYLHHLVTTTIFILFIIIEHAKQVWPAVKTTAIWLVLSIIFSLLFIPQLHDGISPVMKGPWYFLGMQELLHYSATPSVVIWLLAAGILLFALLPQMTESLSRKSKKIFLLISVIYLFLTITGYFFRGANWELTSPMNSNELSNYSNFGINSIKNYFTEYTPVKGLENAGVKYEGCLYCHDEMKGLSPSHNPEAIGCASCHLGNKFSIDKNIAHTGMLKIPGNLGTAHISCGTPDCHPGIKERVTNSLMNTMSGVVSVNKFVFNESDNLNNIHFISNIGNSAADTHLKNLCASCHIGKEKTEFGEITELSRGGGCNACHLQYDENSKDALELLSKSRNDSSIIRNHPSLTINVTDKHCFGCHSRSGRISTNYAGWHETQLENDNLQVKALLKEKKKYRLLQDGRIFSFVQDDIHHSKGLECIDCHNSYELMGNGNLYAHQEEQTVIECSDCHSKNGASLSAPFEELDAESQKIIRLRKFDKSGRRYLLTQKDSIPLINTYLSNENTKIMLGKKSKKEFELKPPGFICVEGKAHNRMSCNSCHTAWAPQCIGCHTDFNPNEEGIDHLSDSKTEGKWEEMVGEFYAEPPTLGIVSNSSGIDKIETFVPGMIMTLDKSQFNNSDEEMIFHRLFAPTVAHTISAKGRSCKSCHNNPLALGYGRGELKFSETGKWYFTPRFAIDSVDGLPQDAWIGFLNENQGSSTRSNARPFTVDEQKRILTVGTCLTCHDENSEVMITSLKDFEKSLDNITSKCKLPQWE